MSPSKQLTLFIYNFRKKTHGIIVLLPRFETTKTLDLKEMLPNLGITQVFNDCCNLGSMLGKPIKIDKMIHKSVIKVYLHV